jgi:hypothetical protein
LLDFILAKGILSARAFSRVVFYVEVSLMRAVGRLKNTVVRQTKPCSQKSREFPERCFVRLTIGKLDLQLARQPLRMKARFPMPMIGKARDANVHSFSG